MSATSELMIERRKRCTGRIRTRQGRYTDTCHSKAQDSVEWDRELSSFESSLSRVSTAQRIHRWSLECQDDEHYIHMRLSVMPSFLQRRSSA